MRRHANDRRRLGEATRSDPGRETRAAATHQNNRYHGIFSELRALGIEAEPAVNVEEIEDEVRAQLTNVDGILVWINPLENGRTREKLDALLREVAATGPWIWSALPRAIVDQAPDYIAPETSCASRCASPTAAISLSAWMGTMPEATVLPTIEYHTIDSFLHDRFRKEERTKAGGLAGDEVGPDGRERLVEGLGELFSN
jgi:hypothetical protein